MCVASAATVACASAAILLAVAPVGPPAATAGSHGATTVRAFDAVVPSTPIEPPGGSAASRHSAPAAADAAAATADQVAVARVARIRVPAVHVDAAITAEPVVAGFLKVPSGRGTTGWAAASAPLEAAAGRTMVAGHVAVGGASGAFARLAQVHPGDAVYTWDGHGRLRGWRVSALRAYPKQALPWNLWGTTGTRRLVLVTCGGPIGQVPGPRGRSYRGYRDNVVVTAIPVAVRAAGSSAERPG